MISVCIITRDEEEKLNRCLNSLKKYPVEVVVVDTGSVDGTLDMLKKWQEDKSKKFELVIGEFEWCDDFSKARNYAASLAKNDIIMVVDSDDVVEEMDLKDLESNISKNPYIPGNVIIKNKEIRNEVIHISSDRLPRVYNRLYIHYTYPIHEQLVPITATSDKQVKAVSGFVNIKTIFNHDGYFGEPKEIEKKQLRNINLLKKQIAQNNDDKVTVSYFLYQLGKSYFILKDYSNAIEYFSKALENDLNPKNSWVVDLVESYGYALLSNGQEQAALGLESVAEEFNDVADFRLMMGSVYAYNNQYGSALKEYFAATKCNICFTEGKDSYLAFYDAAYLNEKLGNYDGALMLYKQCGDYEPAIQKINELESLNK